LDSADFKKVVVQIKSIDYMGNVEIGFNTPMVVGNFTEIQNATVKQGSNTVRAF
jgi:hypothetical protein